MRANLPAADDSGRSAAVDASSQGCESTHMRAAGVLLMTSVLQLGGCLIEPNSSDCATTRCDVCVERSGCGWCGATRRCMPGTSLGANAQCTGNWSFSSCDDRGGVIVGDSGLSPPPSCGGSGCGCAAASTCSDCIARDCDWCVSTNRCEEFISGSCRATDEISYLDINPRCPPPNNCSSRTTCSSCVGSPNCSWCFDRAITTIFDEGCYPTGFCPAIYDEAQTTLLCP